MYDEKITEEKNQFCQNAEACCPWGDPLASNRGCRFGHTKISTLSDSVCQPEPIPPVIYENVACTSVVPDMCQPIVVNWPKIETDENECQPLTCQLPQNTIATESKVLQEPKGGVIRQSLVPHPLCPDAQMTLVVTPPVKKQTEIRIPECKYPPVRPPQRPHIQCVENQRISDRVRRPLARMCHRRPFPPVVIPSCEYQRIQLKMNETERQKAEQEALCAERECERLKSRYRHSLWNYTVESLIAEKRKKEQAKLEASDAADRALVVELKASRDRESEEAMALSKKKMLYGKGLIRDLHSAMAQSTLMKHLADNANQNSESCEQQILESPPFLNQTCINKMAYLNCRPDYTKNVEKKKCSKELVELIKMDENRQRERDEIYCAEKRAADSLRHEEQPPYPENYMKYIQQPKCDMSEDGVRKEKQKRIKALDKELYEDIHNRLSLDAYIESREKEQERQAKCFNHYIQKRNCFVKKKEKELIDENVRRHIEMSDNVRENIGKFQVNKTKGDSNKYNQLREQWEKEYEQQQESKKIAREKQMGLVYKDFWERRSTALCKNQMFDTRQWAREKLDAVNNYNKECESKVDVQREKCEEIALYQKYQIADKMKREATAKHLNCVLDYNTKKKYDDEEKEMRDYAEKCMNEWQANGRPLLPIRQAMKKWDYEGGMFPHPDPYADPLKQSQKCPKSHHQTSSDRLGFFSGGT